MNAHLLPQQFVEGDVGPVLGHEIELKAEELGQGLVPVKADQKQIVRA